VREAKRVAVVNGMDAKYEVSLRDPPFLGDLLLLKVYIYGLPFVLYYFFLVHYLHSHSHSHSTFIFAICISHSNSIFKIISTF
jgi:hypothetical protein